MLCTMLVLNSVYATAAEKEWEYKDWKTSSLDLPYIRLITHGNNVHGHQFGFLIPKADCDASIFWLSLSTYEKGLKDHLEELVSFHLSIDDYETDISLPLTVVDSLTSFSDIAVFTNNSASTELIEHLKIGKEISVDITAPKAIVNKFDITTETFSLSGFTANELKAREACKHDLSVLDIPPRISKEQIQQEKMAFIEATKKIPLPAANLTSDASRCNDLTSAKYIKSFSQLLEYGEAYTVHENYLITADSSDAASPYPNIQILNICDLNNPPLPVVEIPGTNQQVFQLETDGNYLYALSSNHSVGDFYNEDAPGVLFQIIDIKNLEQAIVIGEIRFDGLVPHFKVFDKKAYVVGNDKLSIFDLSSPSNITLEGSIHLHYEQFGADQVALSDNHIFITGNSNLQILNRQSGALQLYESFPFRTSDIIFRNDFIYIHGWGNDFEGSKITIIDTRKPELTVVDTIDLQDRIFSMMVVGNHLLDGEGQVIFLLKTDGRLERL